MDQTFQLPEPIETFLATALPRMRSEPTLAGVAAGGSFIEKRLDPYSDIDLVVVAKDAAYAELFERRFQFAEELGDLVNAFTGEHVGEPRLLICLYGDHPLHVDLKFVNLTDFTDRVEDPVILWERDGLLSETVAAHPGRFPPYDAEWVEARIWTWVHYGATKLGRGEFFEVLDMLAFLRVQVLGPLSKVVDGQLPRGVRRLEQDQPDRVAAFLTTVPTSVTFDDLAESLSSAADLYAALRAKLTVAPTNMRERPERVARTYLARIRREHA
ncbi:Nucleotidyltransferase domain-containing protein [Sulfidibacter corallicola]|uniref:Nucleotidyltransferase domain-containing protein n=1 Tax=Sulfidibacter corallicola TaxID=2818388 RepID=A0A8A4TRK3_SULCO|nr:nucleotidyltransferase domain-containing protein [Sulfidibacter corallicola]QTD49165.1 nucleotidyltransferase domain-containing protein [Sulfidibacter corallicola]